jgi:hypothetical protein
MVGKQQRKYFPISHHPNAIPMLRSLAGRNSAPPVWARAGPVPDFTVFYSGFSFLFLFFSLFFFLTILIIF